MKKTTVGENLKKIRKDLNLKQYQIAGEDVTRNLISLMENNKTPIYHNVANIIAKNINEILAKRGQDIYIQAEDILNPERYEARKKANEYISQLQKQLNEQNYNIQVEKLNEIENFLNRWRFIDKKVKIYELLGDIFYNAKDLNREYYYYIKALEVSYEHPNMKERYKLILKLVYNCIVTKKYQEAIRLCDFAITTQEDITEKYKGIFYFNSALAYYYLKDYDKALDQLVYSKFHVAFDDYREMKRILILEGICNVKIQNYNGALRSYNKLLDIIDKDNIEEICLAYVNLIQIYIEKNNKEMVIKYHNKILELLPSLDINTYHYLKILISVSNTYKYLRDDEHYELYLIEVLKHSNKLKDENIFSITLSDLLDFYMETGKANKIEAILEQYENSIININKNQNYFISLKSIYSYLELNKIEKAKKLIKNILEKEDN